MISHGPSTIQGCSRPALLNRRFASAASTKIDQSKKSLTWNFTIWRQLQLTLKSSGNRNVRATQSSALPWHNIVNLMRILAHPRISGLHFSRGNERSTPCRSFPGESLRSRCHVELTLLLEARIHPLINSATRLLG